MNEDAHTARGIDLGRRFIDAIVEHDWQAISDCFEPDGHFRAVVPNRTRSATTSEAPPPPTSCAAGSATPMSPS